MANEQIKYAGLSTLQIFSDKCKENFATVEQLNTKVTELNSSIENKQDKLSLVQTITDSSSTSQPPSARAVANFVVGRKGDGTRAERFNNSSNVASGEDSHAEGEGTTASGIASHAEGGGCKAIGNWSHAEGCNNGDTAVTANGIGSHAEGRGTTTTQNSSGAHAEGVGTTSGAEGSHSEGVGTQATGNASHAEGQDTTASDWTAHAEGRSTRATASSSHAEGLLSEANNGSAHAEGYNTRANGDCSHSEGSGTQANGSSSHAEGYNTRANGNYGHSEGSLTYAEGENAHAEGKFTRALGEGSHAEGYCARGVYLEIVEGQEGYRLLDQNKSKLPNWLNGYYWEVGIESAIEIGGMPLYGFGLYDVENKELLKATITKTYTVQNGDTFDLYCILDTDLDEEITANPDRGYYMYYGKASGKGSHAEGGGIALGSFSHAEGSMTWAANQAHAEGHMSAAMNTGSHAEGIKNVAHGFSSHAEGNLTKAIGGASHTEGARTKAIGDNSHAEGEDTIASCNNQHVQGKFNVEDTENKYAHIVGGGTSDTDRKNIHTVDWDGNAWYKGDIYVGGTSEKLITKTELDMLENDISTHTSNTTAHITSTERTNWNDAKTHADSAHAPSNAEKNQNAFSNITVGSTTISADTTTDTLTLVGSNVTITPDATNDKVTIAVASGSTSTAGIVKLTNSTSSTSTSTAATPSSVKSAYDLASQAKTAAATAQATADGKANSGHSHSNATTSASGFMSASDKAKLDGIDEGATSIGLVTSGMTYTDADGNTQTCKKGEVFNYYPVGNITIDANGYPNQNLASGNYSHAEGYLITASGYGSHAEGYQAIASGYVSHAEGYQTIASGDYSHAEGHKTTASGYYSHSDGYKTTASGFYSYAGGYQTTANAFQRTVGKYNKDYANSDVGADTQNAANTDALFIVGCGTSTTAKNAFRVTTGGKCYGASTFGATGADFAELFEWTDGNIDNEDRRGLFVTLEGEKIRLANADDDYIGIISGAQAFIGNSASEEWIGKYLTDVFGTKLSQEVEVPEEVDETTGNVITPAHTTTQYIVNPDYDPNKEYVMRENRKEWGIVGLLGQIVMIDDGTCTAGGYVKPSINGIGTASDSGYRVMKRIDENHIKVLVK